MSKSRTIISNHLYVLSTLNTISSPALQNRKKCFTNESIHLINPLVLSKPFDYCFKYLKFTRSKGQCLVSFVYETGIRH